MAKRFSFRLETVLRLRKRKEDQKKRVVAERLREISNLQDCLMSLNEQIASEIRKTRERAGHAHIDVPEMSQRRFWISHLQRSAGRTESRIRESKEQLTLDRKALAEAAKEYRVIEKLREKQFQKHGEELQRLEILEADEMAINRYLRQRREAAE